MIKFYRYTTYRSLVRSDLIKPFYTVDLASTVNTIMGLPASFSLRDMVCAT